MLTILHFHICIITLFWTGYVITNLLNDVLEEESSSCETTCVC